MGAETIALPIRAAWRAAAVYVGHRSVAAWIRCVVDDFLEDGPGRFFPLLPLEWHAGSFSAVRSEDGRTYAPHSVSGYVAGPFGVYPGSYLIGDREHGFTLAHIPTGRKLATLDRLKTCKAMAEEVAALPVRWHLSDPEKVNGEPTTAAMLRGLIARYVRADLPPRLRDIDLPEFLR